MFNLEQAIAAWRRQMIAAGIKTPVPLEELESHLREEIEQQIKLGMDEQTAFKRTASQIGQPKTLKKEFAKSGGFWFWLGGDASTKINRILGTLWLGLSSLGFVLMGRSIWFHISRQEWESAGLFMALFLLATYAAAGLGSILLICGTR